MSSSPSDPGACDALVMRGETQVGVMRMPVDRPTDFVDQFNRTYAAVGIRLVPLEIDAAAGTEASDGWLTPPASSPPASTR